MFVHDFEKRVGNSVKPGGYVIGEGPQANPKGLGEDWGVW
jgi:hypothetical protein